MIFESALSITHFYIESTVKPGDAVIDATMGNGNDTLFLARLVGDTGSVTAFDIQETAVAKTKELLSKNNLSERAALVCDGHENMGKYVSAPIAAVMFNLGYLPGGDHSIATRCETTIAALEAAMRLLKPGGIISLGIYYGGDSGFEEKNAVTEYLKTIDFKKFTVLQHDYVNRPNCPPLAVIIEKTK